MTFDDARASAVSADVAMRSSGLDYVALVLGYTDLQNNLFLKVQDQDSVLGFETFGLYYGNNGENNAAWRAANF